MGGDNNSPNSDMVKHVQQTCGIQDPQQASQYTQEAVNIMNEHGNTNPSGLESLLSNFMGGGQSQSTSTGQQQPQKKKGLLDDVMGSLGVKNTQSIYMSHYNNFRVIDPKDHFKRKALTALGISISADILDYRTYFCRPADR